MRRRCDPTATSHMSLMPRMAPQRNPLELTVVQKHPGEELLAERGHDLIRGRVRIAAGSEIADCSCATVGACAHPLPGSTMESAGV